jgi:hypothetical protein
MNRRIAIVLYFALLATACASDPESVIVGETTAGSADSTDIEPIDPASYTMSPMSTSLVEGSFYDVTSLASLRGTAWVVLEVDGEFYQNGGLSFAWRQGEGLLGAYRDVCAAGSFFVGEGARRSEWVVEHVGTAPTNCAGHPSALFQTGAEIQISHQGGVLVLGTGNGSLRAQHFQSQSVHDETSDPALITVPPISFEPPPFPDLAAPDYYEGEDIEEAIDIPVLECPQSGRAGLKPDPLKRERSAFSAVAKDQIMDLPFLVSFSDGGTLFHPEIRISLSHRYPPSLEWVAEHIPDGLACVEVPPLGYYDRALPLRNWVLSGDHPVLPASETITIVADALCHDVALPPRVSFADDSIRISLSLMHRPYGQPFTDEACGGTELIVIEFDEPVGDRTLVS